MIKASPASVHSQSTSTSPRVAWLLQDAGAYWQPIMSEFQRLLPETMIFSATWNGFLPGFEDSFTVKQVGAMKVLKFPGNYQGYAPCITYLSPRIISYITQYRPDVIFSTGFSVWTTLACLLKPLYGWRIVIVYDGSSPGVNESGFGLRALQRRLLAQLTDAFITNNLAGKDYLTEFLGMKADRVFARPYLMPHPKTYSQYLAAVEPEVAPLQKPVFVFAGHVIPRKGLRELLNACLILKQKGYENYTLLILGDGLEKQELEEFVQASELDQQVQWKGQVKYEKVGAYFQHSDIFVFPTREDVWGMVVVEAMLFGLPILCSKWGGAMEMVVDGENGYIFDPSDSEALANLMARFIDHPQLIQQMGDMSRQIMAEHTPDAVAQALTEVVRTVLQ
jgi:glycosyltransferase involved in cell wall biosynthesis